MHDWRVAREGDDHAWRRINRRPNHNGPVVSTMVVAVMAPMTVVAVMGLGLDLAGSQAQDSENGQDQHCSLHDLGPFGWGGLFSGIVVDAHHVPEKTNTVRKLMCIRGLRRK